MFGLSSLAALAMSEKVARAVLRRGSRPHPPVAGRGLIDAELQGIRDQLPELTAAARDVAELEQILAHASARIEEWTA
jgi:hypothetical protein